jgi:hypothetical protein
MCHVAAMWARTGYITIDKASIQGIIPPLSQQQHQHYMLARVASRTMSSTAAKDITKWASTDGEFKRQVSKFRQEVKQGGKFEPEKGMFIMSTPHLEE